MTPTSSMAYFFGSSRGGLGQKSLFPPWGRRNNEAFKGGFDVRDMTFRLGCR